ncbi:MAG: hypothetical protein IJJ23_01760 [Clostridia bacterium]|nr:hypothetical protein [Clostridia bacterium]
MIDVRTFGAAGDGACNDYPAIQAALDAGARDICIPAGTYLVSDPLKVPSHRHIHAEEATRVIFAPSRPMRQGDFLLTNADTEDGNEDITLEGGVWDGGYGRPNNKKPGEIFEIGSPSGTCLNFVTVKGLKLANLTVANPVGYYIRLGRVRGFEIRDIRFASDVPGPNQDGLHFGGYCRDGLVENMRAVTKGQTNDDLLAFNADDSIQRQENRGLTCGPIENIVCRNIFAEDCHTAIRMASITSPIRHIRIENLTAGCRCMAVNMDALRYCRSPLLVESSAPNGVGDVSDVRIENMTVWFTPSENRPDALLDIEEHCDGVEFASFSRPAERDAHPETPTILARHLTRQTVIADGQQTRLTDKTQTCALQGDIASIRLDRI